MVVGALIVHRRLSLGSQLCSPTGCCLYRPDCKRLVPTLGFTGRCFLDDIELTLFIKGLLGQTSMYYSSIKITKSD